MADLAKVWNPDTLSADLTIVGAGFGESPDLESAVINSLFSDARAPAELLAYMAERSGVSVDSVDPRGWWGDSYAPATATGTADRFGSLLWTLGREKQTVETLNRAREYATDALAWMVDDGLASKVDVTAEWLPPEGGRGRLGLLVTILLTDGRRAELHFTNALGGL